MSEEQWIAVDRHITDLLVPHDPSLAASAAVAKPRVCATVSQTDGSKWYDGLAIALVTLTGNAVLGVGFVRALRAGRYRATSTARLSRMTVTFTWPGYSSWSSISRAISCESSTAPSSSTSAGFTITRISRPAWSA